MNISKRAKIFSRQVLGYLQDLFSSFERDMEVENIL